MLAKKYRLSEEEDFKAVYKKGRFFRTPYFNVKYRPNNLPQARLGVVVSKKIFPKAVDRNKQKRRLRAVWQKQWGKINKKCDFVVLIKPESKAASATELEKSLNNFLHARIY